jgi:hypothetical protein
MAAADSLANFWSHLPRSCIILSEATALSDPGINFSTQTFAMIPNQSTLLLLPIIALLAKGATPSADPAGVEQPAEMVQLGDASGGGSVVEPQPQVLRTGALQTAQLQPSAHLRTSGLRLAGLRAEVSWIPAPSRPLD